MNRPRTLYGHPVCRRCWSGFINRRQLAWILDAFLIGYLVVPFLAGVLFALVDPDPDGPLRGPIYLAVLLGAVAMKDGFLGHSLGKAICGVQVVDQDSGLPAGFGRSIVRNWFLAVPFLPIIVAVTMNKGPRPGDRWARTRVIWKRYRGHPVFSAPAAVAKVFE
jgi:uncharacterized RDD family membrane protein YckC